MNKYHISLHLQFKKNCNVEKLENLLGLNAYRKNMLSESKGQNKTAKLWFKTNDIENRDTYGVFTKFLSSIKDKLEIIKKANEEFDGKAVLTIYFENLTEKPYIKLSVEDMKLLSQNDISFDVDFRI